RLASALLKAGRDKEALEVISRKIADEPENEEAIDLLKETLEKSDKNLTAQMIQTLQQAIYANPANISLVEVLASIQARAGLFDDAVKTLQTSIDQVNKSDKVSAARLYLTPGDTSADAGRDKEAVAAYEAAIKTQSLGEAPV